MATTPRSIVPMHPTQQESTTPHLDAVLAATPPSRLTVAEKLTLAENLGKAGVFPGIANVYQALAAIEVGQSLGMDPGMALMSISFGAQGKPSISVHWQAGRMQQLGWRWEFVRHDGNACEMRFYPPKGRGEPFLSAFSMQDARGIQVFDKEQGGKGASLGEKWNYKSWAKDMLYAFIMRRVVRHYEPRILGGFAGTEDAEAEEGLEAGAYEGQPTTTAQAQQNVSDLFGGEEAPLIVDHTTGEVQDEEQPGQWRADIRVIWDRLPNDFRRQHQKEVISDKTSEERGKEIYGAAVDILNAQQAQRQPGEEG